MCYFQMDLGDFNNMNSSIDGVLITKTIQLTNFLTQHQGGEKKSKFKKEFLTRDHIFELWEKIKDDFEDKTPIFINNNNLSHEVSLITSFLGFKAKGDQNNNKLVINFDHHQDYNKTEHAVHIESLKNDIQFSTWGNFVSIFLKDLQIQKEVDYFVFGHQNKNPENEWGKFFEQKISTKIKQFKKTTKLIDIFISIDTDVYKGSCTRYGDGLLYIEQIIDLISILKRRNDIFHICGVDITGLPDPEIGYTTIEDKEDLKKIYNPYSKNKSNLYLDSFINSQDRSSDLYKIKEKYYRIANQYIIKLINQF